jgi:hypothetical protein
VASLAPYRIGIFGILVPVLQGNVLLISEDWHSSAHGDSISCSHSNRRRLQHPDMAQWECDCCGERGWSHHSLTNKLVLTAQGPPAKDGLGSCRTTVSGLLAKVDANGGIRLHLGFLILPLTAVSVALILTGRNALQVAFIAGTIGSIIGVDLVHLRELIHLGAAYMSIGGRGVVRRYFHDRHHCGSACRAAMAKERVRRPSARMIGPMLPGVTPRTNLVLSHLDSVVSIASTYLSDFETTIPSIYASAMRIRRQ